MQPVRIYECTVVDASPRATATWPDPPAPPAGWPRAGWTANTWSVLLGLAIAAAPLVPFSLAIAETATRTCPGRWWPASSPAPQCSASAPPSCLRGTYAGGTRSRRSAPRHSSATAQPPVVGAKGERAEATPTSRSDASATNWVTLAVRDQPPPASRSRLPRGEDAARVAKALARCRQRASPTCRHDRKVLTAPCGGRRSREVSAAAAAQSASVVVRRWYPNGSCRRVDTPIPWRALTVALSAKTLRQNPDNVVTASGTPAGRSRTPTVPHTVASVWLPPTSSWVASASSCSTVWNWHSLGHEADVE
jgi:hypothetical protein